MRPLLCVVFLWPLGCSSPTKGPTCLAGISVSCVGPGGCSGGQACTDDGSRFGPCLCMADMAMELPDLAMPDLAPPDLRGADLLALDGLDLGPGCYTGKPMDQDELLNACTDAERILRGTHVPTSLWDGMSPLTLLP